jgi:hypothetical protein
MSSVTSMGEARRRRASASVSEGPPLTAFITSWELALEAAAKSPRTVRAHDAHARLSPGDRI